MQPISVKIHSSLEKLLPHTAHSAPTIDNISGLWGETVSFQISIQASATYTDDFYTCVSVTQSYSSVSLFLPEQVPCSFPCLPTASGDYLTKVPALLPDPLVPYNGTPLRLNAHFSQILWAEIPIASQTESGAVTITLCDRKGNTICCVSFPLQVIPVALLPQTTHHSEWFYCDCICDKYNCEMFSDTFFEIAATYFKTAANHSINTLLTPVFTPSLDIEEGGRRTPSQLVKIICNEPHTYSFDFSLLERWVRTAQQCGIEFFEIAPFFTQWGAKFAVEIYAETPNGIQTLFGWDTPSNSTVYADFLQQFLSALMPCLHRLGIAGKTFFHISDEPALEHLEAYKTAYQMIAPYIENCPVLDALSDPKFYEQGFVSIPIVAEDFLSPFLTGKHKGSLWTYCCCAQDKLVPNFFLSMPSVRGRILGVLMYLYKIDGFLRWGFNFWHSQFSKEPIDPYRVTDAGMGFPSGDGFVVYPSSTQLNPIVSIRLKTMREAFEDIRTLQTAEQYFGRTAVCGLIKKHFGMIDFSNCSVCSTDFLAFRQELNQLLATKNRGETN